MSGSLDKTLKCWDLSCFASGPGGRQISPGASQGSDLDRVKEVGGSVCAIDFAGNEVCIDAKEANLRLISV